MLLVPDEGVVEEFAAAGLDPPFRDRVHPRNADTAEDDLDTRIGEDDSGPGCGGQAELSSRLVRRHCL